MAATTVVESRPAANGPAEVKHEILPAPPGARQLAAMPPEARPMPPPPSYPSLGKALAAARDRCKAAHKDARNAHHGYHYASADEVIATANEALEGSGLAIVPASEEMTVIGSGQAAFYALDRVLLLTHESGEVCPMRVKGWPVIPERGRPLDKAYAIALTSSLAYKLRDLLQMPRGDRDDVTAQDDRQTPETPAPPPQAAPAPESKAPVTTEQVDRISALVEQRGLAWDKLNAGLAKRYGVRRVRDLTAEQADQVEQGLLAKQPAKKSA